MLLSANIPISSLYLGEAFRLWDNLLKRYRKKKDTLSALTRSGAGFNDVNRAKQELDKYGFLQWINPHITLRSTITNFDAPPEPDDMSEDDLDSIGNDEEAPVTAVTGANSDEPPQRPTQQAKVGEKRPLEPLPKWSKKDPRMEAKRAEAEVSALKEVSNALQAFSSSSNKPKAANDDGHIKFSEYLATQLKKIKSDYYKFKAKQEMQESIFEYLSP